MMQQLQRLQRLRALRLQLATNLYEKLKQHKAACQQHKELCETRRHASQQEFKRSLVSFEATMQAGDLTGAEFAAFGQRRAYYEKLDLYHEADSLQAEFELMEATERCEAARLGYIAALRQLEKIELLIKKQQEEANAQALIAEEGQAEEAWTRK
jgi:hypothetical protein